MIGTSYASPETKNDTKEDEMLPSTNQRVVSNTSEKVNARIHRQIEANVHWLASKGPAAIEQRLAELDEEWDVERAVEVLAPAGTLLWMLLGTRVNRKLLAVAAMIQGFVMLHAFQGWFPPLPILRRLGFRTSAEIDQERNALKALRGDFRQVDNPAQALEAVCR